MTNFIGRFWFSSIYNEIRRYNQSVLKRGEQLQEKKQLQGVFAQWSADNVDHNVGTLSSKG